MFFDLQYLVLTIPALLFSLWAQWKVHSTFDRFAKVGVQSGYSGAQAAQAVMQSAGVQGVRIERHEGFLSDHYDPLAKALRLSPHVYDGKSISSVAVAAHEAGHAIQDQLGYPPLVWRSALVPLCNVGNMIWIFPFMAGLVLRQLSFSPLLIWTGIGLFAAVVVFQIITLPTEFNCLQPGEGGAGEHGDCVHPAGGRWCKEGAGCRRPHLRGGRGGILAAADRSGAPPTQVSRAC